MDNKDQIIKLFDYSKIKKCSEYDFSNEKGICKFFHYYAGLHNGCIKERAAQAAEGANMYLEDLELSTRAYNCLKRQDIDTVEKLQGMTDEKLRLVRNLGEKCFNEVKEKLRELQAAEPK